MKQNYVNHIALVLDASLSMQQHTNTVVKVADDLIKHLATRSSQLDQETRVSIYTFSDTVQCVIYDKDVLRLPSISTLYKAAGNTALIDAVLLSQDDLALTPEKYGDHAFLTYVLTDGEENRSKHSPQALSNKLRTLPDHWTVAVLVPNMAGKHEAKKVGFATDNIEVWDATSKRGLEEAASAITQATDTYMANRSKGVRGSKNLFTMTAGSVNRQTIAAAGMVALKPDQFALVPVPVDKSVIKTFVESCGFVYKIGRSYYQLSKPEKVQGNKSVALVEKKTNKVFVGYDARQLLGLPDYEVRVGPDFHPEYQIFIQSSSINRHLMVGTKLLVLL